MTEILSQFLCRDRSQASPFARRRQCPLALMSLGGLPDERWPEHVPHAGCERVRFTRVSAKSTKVTLTQTGWKEGNEWDKADAYLTDGNAQLLETLYQRFEKGPIDWAKAQA